MAKHIINERKIILFFIFFVMIYNIGNIILLCMYVFFIILLGMIKIHVSSLQWQ